jgi:hypothetical protein
MNQLLLGALVMASTTVGLFFLRFWRETRDRLFLMFALAFWTLAANWFGLALIDAPESRTALYALRLVGFLLIVVAIADKNRAAASTRAARPPSPPDAQRTAADRIRA